MPVIDPTMGRFLLVDQDLNSDFLMIDIGFRATQQSEIAKLAMTHSYVQTGEARLEAASSPRAR